MTSGHSDCCRLKIRIYLILYRTDCVLKIYIDTGKNNQWGESHNNTAGAYCHNNQNQVDHNRLHYSILPDYRMELKIENFSLIAFLRLRLIQVRLGG